jgi:hypothetical protein
LREIGKHVRRSSATVWAWIRDARSALCGSVPLSPMPSVS